MRKLIVVGLIILLGISLSPVLAQAAAHDTYLDLAINAYDRAVESVPGEVERWTSTYEASALWGYGPPHGPIWLSGLAGSLYELTGDEKYAIEAAKWISTHHRFKEYYPQSVRKDRPDFSDGLPTLTDFFHLPVVSRAYLQIKDSPSVTDEQREQMKRNMADSADYMLVYPEWGPMNRAILRAEGLLFAALAMPDHPDVEKWKKLSRILASDSWGHWSEEDAEIYHPIWIQSLIHYADALGDGSLFDLTTTRFYFDYFLHLLSPAAMVPEFGDARWNESWPAYLTCFERGAKEYQRADLKWAAERIAGVFLERHSAEIDPRTALTLTDAYRWADGELDGAPPTTRSEEVLEDLVGKKIVFRNGWEDNDTYLMLNYRDEGSYARIHRDFLRHTIPVEEEKMHHGHSDENAICLLMSNNSILLHNPGYRDAIPSGLYGAYRADYFHNSFVARPEKRDRKQDLYEFLRNSGGHHTVATEKIDFLNLKDVDMSRTRVIDEKRGYETDRVIVWVRDLNIFFVFDIAKILETDYYTFTTLWHGTSVEDKGSGTYITAVDSIRTFKPEGDDVLLIHFPQKGTRIDGTFPIRRARQDEIAVYQTLSSHYYAGHLETITSVLEPIQRGADTGPLVREILPLEVYPPRAGIGIRLERDGVIHLVCVKTDLLQDILNENVRPRYTWESGAVMYGPIRTDASFLYARINGDEISYSASNMIKIGYRHHVLFESHTNTFGLEPDDLGTGYGAPKWRYWEETAILK